MDFNDSDDDAQFRAELRHWLDANAPRKASDPLGPLRIYLPITDESALIAEQKRWQQKLFAAGWAAITWPKEYGGREATPSQTLIFKDLVSRYEIPNPSVFLIGHGMIGPTIMAHGTVRQRERFIAPLAEGREIWCQLWSEPNAGSDLAALETRADRDSETGGWILRGQKVWTTFAHVASWGLCLARTDSDVPKHKGLSVFIVKMTAPGVTVRPLRQITGETEFNEVFFDDVRLPADSLVGPVNEGWAVAMTTLMNERYAGGLMGDLTEFVRPLVDLAKCVPIDPDHPYEYHQLQDEIARVFIQAKLVTLTGYRSLASRAESAGPGPEGSLMKLSLASIMTKIAILGTRILGLGGVDVSSSAPDEGVWPAMYLNSQSSRIAGGTDDIQRNIIAERVLLLPREKAADAGLTFREAKALRSGARTG